MEGMITRITPAIIRVMDWASSLLSILIPICTVLISLEPVTSSGHIYIFHALMKVYTAMAQMCIRDRSLAAARLPTSSC